MSPPPLPPPPSPPAPPFFLIPGLITTRVHSYTWYTGVSQNNFLRQKYLAFIFFEDLSKPPFFCRFAPVHFCNTFCRKMLSFFHHSTTRESFPDFSFITTFSPLPKECQLFMPKDFLEPPCLTLLGEPLVLRERVEGGKQITRHYPNFIAPCPRIHKHRISHLQFLHF